MLTFTLLICLIKLVNCVFINSNSTDLSNCVVSYSRSGSVYKEFYPLNINENQNDTMVLDFHFAVLASSDAHILLAEFDNLTKTDPAYEIVIGAGGNTFSDIRRMQKSEVKQSARIKGLLSALDPRFFWLHITKDGAIRLGVEGQNTSFIEWVDPEPLKVKFVSFSTWSGIEAKWYFNCNQSEEEIMKRLSATAKLRRFLLKLYDPLVRPVVDEMTTTEVYMSLDIMDLEFDEDHITLDIRGFSRLTWYDEKLYWNSSLYRNISVIHVDSKEIWTPSLKCFQSVSATENFLLDTILSVNNIGNVFWESTFRMLPQCQPSNKGNWPRDIYVCIIFFSLTDDYGGVFLNFSYNDSDLLIQREDDQWNVLEALLFEMSLNSSMHTPAWGLSFQIRRSSLIYSTVFLLPLFVITTCLLFTFWVSPRGNTKLFLGCSQIIIEILILLSLAHFIPHKSAGIPLLIILYGLCLVCSLTALIISVTVLNLCKKKRSKPLPHAVSNILTKKAVKTALILPNIVVPEDYGDLDLSTSFNNVSRPADKDHTVWVLLAMAIERIFFFIYLICMTAIIIKYVIACF